MENYSPKLLQLYKNKLKGSVVFNLQKDTLSMSESLFKQIEERRGRVTTFSPNSTEETQPVLKVSANKQESRINALYRLIGLPGDTDLSDEAYDKSGVKLINSQGSTLSDVETLRKDLLQREFRQFSSFLQVKGDKEAQVDATEERLRSSLALFNPQNIIKRKNHLLPPVQLTEINYLTDPSGKIAPLFATKIEKTIDSIMIPGSFLETVLMIRLLPQSGLGDAQENFGAVEELLLDTLAISLKHIVLSYTKNQTAAEKLIVDGIMKIRDMSNVNNPLHKKGDSQAGSRDPQSSPNSAAAKLDKNSNSLSKIYDSIVSLLPTTKNLAAAYSSTGANVQVNNIADNALTGPFLDFIKLNNNAVSKIQNETKETLKKRQAVQDNLTAEIMSLLGRPEFGDVSMSDVLIVITALFILDEPDLVGLIPTRRFKQLAQRANNRDDSNPMWQILKEYDVDDPGMMTVGTKTNMPLALSRLSSLIVQLYEVFADELSSKYKEPIKSG